MLHLDVHFTLNSCWALPVTPSHLAATQHDCWPQQAGLQAERRHLRDICHIFNRPLCNTPNFLLSLSCFVPIYEGLKQVPGLTQPVAITCPWVRFKPLNAPGQIAPAEKLLLVCSFLWPPLINMPIITAERQCMMSESFIGFTVSFSLSSLPFRFVFPAKPWCSFLYSFPLPHPR